MPADPEDNMNEQVFEEEDDELDLSDLRNAPPQPETIRERLQRAAQRRATGQQEKNWHDTPVNVTPSGRHEIVEEEGEVDDSDLDVDEVVITPSGRHQVVDEDIDVNMDDLDESTLDAAAHDSSFPGPATRIEEELDLAGLRAAPPITAGPMTMAAFDMGNADDAPDDTDGPVRGDTERIVAGPDRTPAREQASGPMTMAAMEMEAGGIDNPPDEESVPTVEVPGASAGDLDELGGSGPMTMASMEMESDIAQGDMSQGDKVNGREQLPSGETVDTLLDNNPQQSEQYDGNAAHGAVSPEEGDANELELNAAEAGSEEDQSAAESENLDLEADAGGDDDPGEEEPGAVSGDSTPAEPYEESQQPEVFTVGDDSGAPLGRGLDVGTANLVAARMDEEGGIEFFPARNAFLDVPEDPYTLKMLKGQGVPYIKRENKLFIIGEDAFELANIFNREMRRPMKNGLISPTDVDAMPMEVELFKKILGPPRADGEVVYYSIPADPVDSTMNIVYHTNIANGLLERLGYRGHPFNEGQAIVFSELGDDDFTGIGISCGGGMVNVCVCFRSMPVVSFSTAKGGDWIDQQAAQVMGCAASKITAVKERGVDINAPKTPEEEAIVIYYRHLIKYSLDNIVKKFETTKDIPNFPKPVPIAVSGGTSKVGGFVDVFKDEFSKMASRFPIKVSDIRKAEDQLNATAKGCLLAALSHED
ncbi:MAG: hypothetical protein H6841_05765 [Planctomycetes bacterium]|nr:hypothetical protein [Planctomycetota bacterium]MCB9934338.1 hypothetical protein [Planctomycetota bacterium]